MTDNNLEDQHYLNYNYFGCFEVRKFTLNNNNNDNNNNKTLFAKKSHDSSNIR